MSTEPTGNAEKWFGSPGHFICSFDCRFHMCTLVGDYLVSTVGQLFPDSTVREILAKSRGVELKGIGDARKADYMAKIGFDEIGYGRKYETMVFKAGKPCDAKGCGCGLPALADGVELDSAIANDAKTATANHYELLRKWKNVKGEL